MSDIQKVKDSVFRQVNKFTAEMIENKYENKHFRDSVSNLKKLEGDIEEKGYGDYACVYAFFDENEKLQYVGKAMGWVWRRLHSHINKKANGIKDNWTILVLYGKLWICTHEWIEKELHDTFPDSKHLKEE